MTPRHGGLAGNHGSMIPPAIHAEPRSRISERSESGYGSTRPGPKSIQELDWDLLHAGEQLVPKSDSGFYSNPSLESSNEKDAGVPDLAHVGTGTYGSFDADVAPWYPGSRIDFGVYIAQDRPLPDLLADSVLDVLDLPPSDQPFYLEPDHNVFEPGLESTHDQYSYPYELIDGIKDPFGWPESSHPTIAPPKPQGNLDYERNPSTSADAIECEHCNTIFTGLYRRGNRSRHVRQQHPELLREQPQCICRVCKKVYKRQDARRKHEWQKHRLQDSKPSRRKLAPTPFEPTYSPDVNSDDTETIQEVSSSSRLSHNRGPGGAVGLCYRVPPAHSVHAHVVFATIKSRLDVATYNSFCDTFLVRWERIVEELRLKRSDTYDVFAKALGDLSTQLYPDPQKTYSSYIDDVDQPNETEGHDKPKREPESRADRGKGPAQPQTARAASKRSTGHNRRLDKLNKRSGDEPSVTDAEPREKVKSRKVDCPIHKYYVMHGLQSPCGGIGKETMNLVRQHLERSNRHRGFHGFVSFVRRCVRCKDDIVDEQAWHQGHHEAGTCTQRDQPRGTLVVRWARLYLGIYPEETRVPVPYIDEDDWLPDELVAPILPVADQTPIQPQGPSHTDQPFDSFLGQPSPHLLDPSSHEPSAREPSQDAQLASEASLETILHDVLDLAARLLAAEQAEKAPAQRSSEDVEAEFRVRLNNLRTRQIQVDTTGTTHGLPGPTSTLNSALSNMQSLSSDSSTHPSSLDYSGGFSSFFGSSQTSLSGPDAANISNQAQPPSPYRGPVTFTDLLDCPPADGLTSTMLIPALNEPRRDAQGPWLPTYEPLLDQPGSSRMPQILAELNQEAWMLAYCKSLAQSTASPSGSEVESREEQGRLDVE